MLPPPLAIAVLLAAACVPLAAGCVPRPATLGSPSAATTNTSTATIGPSTTTPSGPGEPTPTPSFVRPTLLPAPSFLAYAVKRQDTLTSIAREFRTTPRSIAFWSRGEHPSLDPESATYEPDRLEVGWVLLLIPDAVFDEDELMDATPSPAPGASAGAAPSPTPSAPAG